MVLLNVRHNQIHAIVTVRDGRVLVRVEDEATGTVRERERSLSYPPNAADFSWANEALFSMMADWLSRAPLTRHRTILTYFHEEGQVEIGDVQCVPRIGDVIHLRARDYVVTYVSWSPNRDGDSTTWVSVTLGVLRRTTIVPE